MEDQNFINSIREQQKTDVDWEQNKVHSWKSIEQLLYRKGEIPDVCVAKQVYEVVRRQELLFAEEEQKNVIYMQKALAKGELPKFQKIKKTIPNFVIMGGPGSGKTTLAKRLAEYMSSDFEITQNVEVSIKKQWLMEKSSSDLKGTHVGHTAGRVFDMLKEASLNNQVIFIDEAYHLQEDEFGREAVDMLLPLLSGDRDEIEKVVKDETEKFSFSKDGNGVPPIWFGGYEHEMRKMLSQNVGLYRRMIKLSLSTPGASELYRNLCALSEENPDCCQAVYENEKEIKNYFAWGMRPEYVNYFSAYAGVRTLYETMRVYLSRTMTPAQAKKQVREIIEDKKAEIKRQYKAVMTDLRTSEFEVETDVLTNMNDIIGNQETVEVLRNIIECLYQNAKGLEEGEVPKGILLSGPSGTGKTSMARAVAGEIQKRFEENAELVLKAAFIPTVASELMEKGKLERLFKEAEEYDVCIIFIDEMDAAATSRELQYQLLKEMDGFVVRKNVFVIGAVSTAEIFDLAFLRPGRFERILELSLPKEEERKQLLSEFFLELPFLQKELQEEKHKRDLLMYIEKYAVMTMGYSQADLKGLVNRAAMECRGKEAETKSLTRLYINTFEMLLVKNHQLGTPVVYQKKVFHDTTYDEVSALTVHQLGHYYMSELLPVKKNTENISILFRTDSSMEWWRGQTPVNRETLLHQIKLCLGSRLLEELFYGDELSVWAMEDVRLAQEYARKQLELFGPWHGIEEAEALVREQLYLLGKEMQRKGHKKERFLSAASLLHRKECIRKEELQQELRGAKRAEVSYPVGTYQDIWLERVKKQNETAKAFLSPKKAEKVLHIDSDPYRHKQVKYALKGCGIKIIDYVSNQEQALKQLEMASEQEQPYDFIVMEPESDCFDMFGAKNYRGIFSDLEAKKITLPVLICSMFDLFVRSKTGVVWYIQGRDMTENFREELLGLQLL